MNRLKTVEVKIGDLLLGNLHPIRVQTMTTTDTMDTEATIRQTIKCIEAGAELVRITAPSKKEAENLLHIKNGLHSRGYNIPLVADIHFTPNAAEIAARIVEKVRVNPGNYVDKKKFEFIEFTDQAYNEEIERIRERFTPLVKICKEYGTAMRIGTNHGSLSDRIMSRYGDSAIGMVESAMEFLRISRDENYHNIVLSMKSSNPLVMVQAYRLLVQTMQQEFGILYPLHLGVTEAGDGEDGRIKSAIGIGTLLEDGIGDTIRVSLTEDPEFEIPVCRDLVKRYEQRSFGTYSLKNWGEDYSRRTTVPVDRTGGSYVPVVIADYAKNGAITKEDLEAIGYKYDAALDKWNIADAAADYVFTGNQLLPFALPGTLQVLCNYETWKNANDKSKYFPVADTHDFLSNSLTTLHKIFVLLDIDDPSLVSNVLDKIQLNTNVVLCVRSGGLTPMTAIRDFFYMLEERKIKTPVIIRVGSNNTTIDEQLIHFSTEAGALLLDGFGDGVWLTNNPENIVHQRISGRTYLEMKNNHQFINNTSFSILQATRTRISKTEYISCPSCGRTLFDLQETTAKIRAVTHHLKGVKIAIMGCIVNGPGEMADADFGYVGSGPGKITLYKGKEVIKRSVNSEVAVDELINLLKENGAWVEP